MTSVVGANVEPVGAMVKPKMCQTSMLKLLNWRMMPSKGYPPGSLQTERRCFLSGQFFFRLGPEFVVSQFLVNEFSKAQRDGSGFGG